MKNLLLIAYYFPPTGGPGTQRSAKFAKYLGEFGWCPWVLTRPDPAVSGRWDPQDPGLLRDVGDAVNVVRVPELAALRPACVLAALRRVEAQLRAHPVDAVLVTMSPFELSHLGRLIRQHLHLPVVYDLRDPWALDGVPTYGSRRVWNRAMQQMTATLCAADGVVANTPESRAAILARLPGLNPERVVAIPNGFDAEDFNAGPAAVAGPSAPLFRLVHTGSFLTEQVSRYRGPLGWLRWLKHYRPEPLDPSGRTPVHLLRAVARLRAAGHPAGTEFRLVHVGPVDAATQRCFDQSGVSAAVECLGYLPHTRSVAQVLSADALFLHLHGLPSGHRSLIVPGKTYEYLAAGRPILGCLPQGDARELVERTGRGYCADPCDAADIARALVRLHDDLRRDTWQRPREQSWIQSYERRALTRELASFLDRIVALSDRSILAPDPVLRSPA